MTILYIRILDNLSGGSREDLANICHFVENSHSNVSAASDSDPVDQLVVGDILDELMIAQVLQEMAVVDHLASNTVLGHRLSFPARIAQQMPW